MTAIAVAAIGSGGAAWLYADAGRVLWTRMQYSNDRRIIDVAQYEPLTPIGAGQRYEARRPLEIGDAAATSALRDLARRTSSNIVVINRSGELIFEAYHASADADELMLTNSMSMAKSLVALLVGAAIDQGAVRSVEQPIEDFLPELRGDARGRITLEQLLRMESGLQRQDAGFPFTHLSRMYYGTEPHDIAMSVPLARSPGSFEYNSVNTQLLLAILERTFGAPFEDLLTRYIWEPLGLDSGFGWRGADDGQSKGFCCVFATARSWAEIGRLFLGGQPRAVVSQSWLNEMAQSSEHVANYGYQVWLGTLDDDRAPFVSFEGSPQQFVFALPTRGIAAVRVGPESSAFSTEEFLAALGPLRH